MTTTSYDERSPASPPTAAAGTAGDADTTARRHGVYVGLFVVLGLLLLVGVILTIGDLNDTFTRKITVSATFDDVDGVKPGTNVWFSGVKIGTVKDVAFTGEAKVEVTLKVDERSLQYIAKDARAKVSSDGLIGNKIIVLTSGTAGQPRIEEGDHLATDESWSAEELVATFRKTNDNLLAITTDAKLVSARAAAGEGTLGKLSKDEVLYGTLERTLALLESASTDTRALAASLSHYGSKLDDEGTLANDLVTDRTVFPQIREAVTHLDDSVAKASEIMDGVHHDLSSSESPVGVLLNDEKSGADLRSTLAHLDASSQKLDEDLEALQHNFLLRRYFKKQAKSEEKAAQEEAQADADPAYE
jgi:phospholipid/cholesterol/gamma-HCH transport system substrate-binding protein